MKDDTLKLFEEIHAHEGGESRLKVAPTSESSARAESKAAPKPSIVASSQPTRRPARAARVTRSKDGVDHRINIPRALERKLGQLAFDVGTDLQCSVPKAFLVQPAIELLCDAAKEIRAQAKKVGPLSRPGNDDAEGLAEFRQELKGIVRIGLRPQ